jgi:hypothetical protein
MTKKLDNLRRVYQELIDRYGSEDVHVQLLRSELDVEESVEFMCPSKLTPKTFQSRTLGGHRRHAGMVAANKQV